MTESELVEGLRAGDATACRFLLDQYGKKVYNTALNLLQHPQDAEDLAQEVFVQAFQSVGGFKQQSALSTWLYRITVNKVNELQRSRGRQKRLRLPTDLSAKEVASNAATDFVHPGVVLENQERAQILWNAIGQLPENQKTAFVLCKIEGLSQAEAAKIMETTAGAIESLLSRAQHNLRKTLGDYYQMHYHG